jgi:hypothetical protein
VADPFKSVSPGEELTIPAVAWNTILGMARRENTGAVTGTGIGRQATIVKVKNETDGPLPRNSVVGLGDPIFTPYDTDDDVFLREPTFRAYTPDITRHLRRFAVLLDPALDGGVVRAYVAGICPVKVSVDGPNLEYATIIDGGTEHLQASRYGYAQILWSETDQNEASYGGYGPYPYDTGVMWCLVRLGSHCPSVAAGKANGAISAMSGTTYGTGSVDIYRAVDGEEDGPVETVDVLNPGTLISGGKRVSIGWDMDGSIFVAPLECE